MKLKLLIVLVVLWLFSLPSAHASTVCTPFCDEVTISQGETVVIDFDFTPTPPPHIAQTELSTDFSVAGSSDSFQFYVLADGYEYSHGFTRAGGIGAGIFNTIETVQMVLYDITGSFGISAYWLRISLQTGDLDQVNPNCQSDCATIFHPATILIDPANIPQVTNLGSPPNLITPLPAALPLFATGLGMMGLFDWRRKRKEQAARGV
jgi:hypothetical protein